MPACRSCGLPVAFKPHPQNPAKLAPFNPDGEIHFKTCNAKKKEFSGLSEIMCQKCEELPLFLYEQMTAAGPRLTVMCDQFHRWHIPYCEANLALVNASEQRVRDFMQILEMRWQKNFTFHRETTAYRARFDGETLSHIYAQCYGPVSAEEARVLREFNVEAPIQ